MEADHSNTENVSSGSASDEEIFNLSRTGRDMSMEIVESRLRQKFEEQKFDIQRLTTERDRCAKNSETKSFKIHSLNRELQEVREIHEKELQSIKEFYERQSSENIAADRLVQKAIFALQDHWVHRSIDAEAIKLLLNNLRKDARDLVQSKFSLLSVLEEAMLMVDECYTLKDEQLSDKDLTISRLQSQIVAQDEFQHYLDLVRGSDGTLECANSKANIFDIEHNNSNNKAINTSPDDAAATVEAALNRFAVGDVSPGQEKDTTKSYIATLQEQIVCYKRLLHYKTLKCNLLTRPPGLGTKLTEPASITVEPHWADILREHALFPSGSIVGPASEIGSSPHAYISYLVQQSVDKNEAYSTLYRQHESLKDRFRVLSQERNEAQERSSRLSAYEAQIERLTSECSDHKAKLEEGFRAWSGNFEYNKSQHDELLKCRDEYSELNRQYQAVTKFMEKLEADLLAVTSEFANKDAKPVHARGIEIVQNKHNDIPSAGSIEDGDNNQDIGLELTEQLKNLIESNPPVDLVQAYEELFSQDEFPSIHNLEQREVNTVVKNLEAEITDLKTKLEDANVKHRDQQQKLNEDEREHRRITTKMSNMTNQLKSAFQNLYTVNPEIFEHASSSVLKEILRIFNVEQILTDPKTKAVGSCLDYSMLKTPHRNLDQANAQEVEKALLDLLMYFSELQDALEGIVDCTKVLIPFDTTYILEPTYDFIRQFVEPLQSHLTHNAIHHRGRTVKLASTLDFKLDVPWQIMVTSLNVILKDLTQVLPYAYAIQSELQNRDYSGFCKELQSTQDPCSLIKQADSLTTRHILHTNPDLNATQLTRMKDSEQMKLLHKVVENHRTTLATMLLQLNHAPTTMLTVLNREQAHLNGTPPDLVPMIVQGCNKAVTREVYIDRVKVKLEEILASLKRLSLVMKGYTSEIESWELNQKQRKAPNLSTVIEENTEVEYNGEDAPIDAEDGDDDIDGDDNNEDEEEDEGGYENDDDVEDNGDYNVTKPFSDHDPRIQDSQIRRPQTSAVNLQHESEADDSSEEDRSEKYDRNYSSNDADSEDNSLPLNDEDQAANPSAIPPRIATDEEYRRGVWD